MWKKQGEVSSPSFEPEPIRPITPEAPKTVGVAHARPDVSRVSKGIKIRGEVNGRGDLHVDGQVEGTINLEEASVTVGAGGHVVAEVNAREITVHGNVEGDIEGTERVVLGRSGALEGDIKTRRLIVEDGAELRGRVEMPRAAEVAKPRPAPAAELEVSKEKLA